MKYIFSINSRVKLSESAELKHDKLMKFLQSLDSPWGLRDNINIPFADFGRNESSILSLTKFLDKKIKMTVFYPYRGNNIDDSFK